jgi:hypothetical protein
MKNRLVYTLSAWFCIHIVLSKLPNLEYVEITSTATTAAGIEKLKAAKPSLTIIHHNLGGD